jgi:hypothetical protein
MLSHRYVRWVNPAAVLETVPHKHVSNNMLALMGDDLDALAKDVVSR